MGDFSFGGYLVWGISGLGDFGVKEKLLIFISLLFVIVVAVGWVKNILKLTQCDFIAPVKCEVIHLIGLFPPVGAVTGWVDIEENSQE